MDITKYINDGYMFICNHSGGKDSQAMLISMIRDYKIPLSQLIVIHADLGRFEWGESTNTISAKDHMEYCCNEYGLTPIVVSSEHDLFDLCRKYKRFPSGLARFCTSELKTRPISKYIKSLPYKKIINCMGIRKEESPNRAKGLDKVCFETSGQSVDFASDKKLSTKGIDAYTWYPIFELTTQNVYDKINNANQHPHEAYTKYGMSRLSCVFCVMASKPDLKISAKTATNLLNEYVELEKELGKTVFSLRKEGKPVLIDFKTYVESPIKRTKFVWKYQDSLAIWQKLTNERT